MRTSLAFMAAAVLEIAGCFAFWSWLRLGRSPLWVLPGMLALVLFAWLLTLAESELAGRAFAAYGGIYIVTSLLWLWIIEGARPERPDLIGALLCLVGAGIILMGARGS